MSEKDIISKTLIIRDVAELLQIVDLSADLIKTNKSLVSTRTLQRAQEISTRTLSRILDNWEKLEKSGII